MLKKKNYVQVQIGISVTIIKIRKFELEIKWYTEKIILFMYKGRLVNIWKYRYV